MTLLAATNWRETKGKLTELTGPLEECHFPETISDPNIHCLSTHIHTQTYTTVKFFSFFFFLSLSFPHFLAKFFPEKKMAFSGIIFDHTWLHFGFWKKGRCLLWCLWRRRCNFGLEIRESLSHQKIFPRKIGVSLSFLWFYLTPIWFFLAKGSFYFMVFVVKKVRFWAGELKGIRSLNPSSDDFMKQEFCT